MTTRNDITGDALITGASTDSYRDGWDRIFGKKPNAKTVEAMKEAQAIIAHRAELGQTPEEEEAFKNLEKRNNAFMLSL